MPRAYVQLWIKTVLHYCMISYKMFCVIFYYSVASDAAISKLIHIHFYSIKTITNRIHSDNFLLYSWIVSLLCLSLLFNVWPKTKMSLYRSFYSVVLKSDLIGTCKLGPMNLGVLRCSNSTLSKSAQCAGTKSCW